MADETLPQVYTDLYKKRLQDLQELKKVLARVRIRCSTSADEELSFALQRIEYAIEATHKDYKYLQEVHEKSKLIAEYEKNKPETRVNGC